VVHTLNTIFTRHVIYLDKNYQTCLFQIQKLKSTHKCKGFKQHVPFYSKKTCDEEKLDQIEDLLEASPSPLATSVVIMKCNTTDEFV
jgi:hypothetical protein